MAVALTDNSTNRITASASPSLNNKFFLTWWCWLKYSTVTSANRDIWLKGPAGSSRKRFRRIGSNQYNFDVSTSGNNATAISAPATISPSVWYFLAVTYQFSDGARIFIGTLNSLADEVSYDTRTSPSGVASDDDGGDYHLGSNGSTDSVGASFAWNGYIERRLLLPEIRSLQMRPRNVFNSRLLWNLIYPVFSAQPDLSGNGNSGTCNGSAAPHIPLGPAFGSDTPVVGTAAAAGRRRAGALLFS